MQGYSDLDGLLPVPNRCGRMTNFMHYQRRKRDQQADGLPYPRPRQEAISGQYQRQHSCHDDQRG